MNINSVIAATDSTFGFFFFYIYISQSLFNADRISSLTQVIYMLRVASIISCTRGRVGGQLVGPFNPLSL